MPLRAPRQKRRSGLNTPDYFTSLRNSSCANFFPARMIERMHFSPFIPELAAPSRAIGPTCCCACISAGSSEARSEERRVGKECRSGGSTGHERKKEEE